MSALTADVTIKVYVHRQCVYTVCVRSHVRCLCVSSVLLSVECGKDVLSLVQMILMCRPVGFHRESVFVLTECHFNSVLGNESGNDRSPDEAFKPHKVT